MARKQKKERSINPIRALTENLAEETKHAVLAVLFFALALFFTLSFFGYAGIAGKFTYENLSKVLGAGFFILPIACALLAVSFFRSHEINVLTTNVFGGVLFLFSTLGLLELLLPTRGGYLGGGVAYVFANFFGVLAGGIFLVALITISLLIIFNTRLPKLSFKSQSREKTNGELSQKEASLFTTPPKEIDTEEHKMDEDEDFEPSSEEIPDEEDSQEVQNVQFSKRFTHYTLPPLSLLEKDSGKATAGDIKTNANIIKRTLLNFNINVEIDEVSVGPSITRYALKPAEGVRLSRIVALQNDLALALAAHPVRIEAPIPGKSLVGIEIPNAKKSIVGLATLLSAKEYTERPDPLLVALGKTVTGTPLFANITKAPHMLIAGATGAGKSVTIHSIISSLLFRNTPDALRFIMIDPKRVELTLYNEIPHLLTPVLTDPKKAILSLKWAIKEMERRYNILETERVRDITAYQKSVIEPAYTNASAPDGDLPELMPYIIIIIDELADIMATYPKELESAIVRLAQMSRAVGIHLILSTQRPSVNVITGLIKANIPTRVALQVSSQIDSRTILDMAGAEKLLGSGDMLYMSADMAKPVRLQSAFVTEPEVKKVVGFLKKENKEGTLETIDLGTADKNKLLSVSLENDADLGEEDDLYEDAKGLVLATGKASTSYLQRKLGIGYSRAARLIDILEERGVVGPADGSRARAVYQNETSEAPAEELPDEETPS